MTVALCFAGAMMMAWAAMHAMIRFEDFGDGSQPSFVMFEQMKFASYGWGLYCSAAMSIIMGMWAFYLAARIVVAQSDARQIAKPWIRMQEFIFVLSIIMALVAPAIDEGLKSGVVELAAPWLPFAIFISAIPTTAPLCGIGSYVVARYVENALSRDDVKLWFAFAEQARTKKAEIPDES